MNGHRGFTNIKAAKFITDGSDNTKVVLGDGTTTAINGLSVASASTATKLSSITDGSSDNEKKLIVLGEEGVIFTVPNIKANYAKNTLTITSASG